MVIGKVLVRGASANARCNRTVTSGMVGAVVEFEFDSLWDGLTKTAVFRCRDVTRDVLDIGTEAAIPPEVLAKPGSFLEVGIYGTNPDSTLVIPTIWVHLTSVQSGADPSGDPSTDPSLPVWAQLQEQIDDLKENGGGGGVAFEVDKTLILKDGVLSVNTADAPQKDNTLPITSAAVHTTVGNIEAILKTI